MNLYAQMLEVRREIERLEISCGVRSSSRTARYRAGKRLWNPEDEAFLCEHYPHEPTGQLARKLGRSLSSVYNRVEILGLEKTAEYLASPAARGLLRGEQRGVEYQFRKGHVPANKGLRRPGYAPGRMRETQFKKGQAPLNHMPLGSTRIVAGYLYRKISDIRHVPWTRNWVPEHCRLWEAANGPLPAGHAVAFKNGDRTDIRLDNLECITRRELMSRNTVHNLPKELRSTIQLLGALNRQINRKMREANEKQD